MRVKSTVSAGKLFCIAQSPPQTIYILNPCNTTRILVLLSADQLACSANAPQEKSTNEISVKFRSRFSRVFQRKISPIFIPLNAA